MISSVGVNPIAFSMARMAVDMCDTGQMPQILAVMSGASSKFLPFRNPSKKRGGSQILSFRLYSVSGR